MNLDKYTWDNLEDLFNVSVGDTKNVDFRKFGTHELTVAGIDYFCPDSITFITDPITSSMMSEYYVVGGLSKADSLLSTIDEITNQFDYDLMSHLPMLGYEYKVEGKILHRSMRATVPAVDYLVGDNKLPLFNKSYYLKSNCAWWTADFEDDKFYNVSAEGKIGKANPDESLGVRLLLTYVRNNVDRLNYVGIKYPDVIGDTDVLDCITFNSSMERVDKVYYPLMFCI